MTTTTKSPVAENIRKLREARHWSQEELAAASGVDARTIQRAEAGHSLALDTLKALAAAFDTTVENLQVSEEELAAVLEDFRRNFKIIEMRVLTSSSDLGDLIGTAADARQIQRVGRLTEEQLDRIAELDDYLSDYGDVWGDLGPSQRREGEKSLFELIQAFPAAGMSVSFGLENLRLSGAAGKPFRVGVLYVAATAGSVPLLALVREKNVPVSFQW